MFTSIEAVVPLYVPETTRPRHAKLELDLEDGGFMLKFQEDVTVGTAYKLCMLLRENNLLGLHLNWTVIDAPREVDYKALLKKYIHHVGVCEGTTFLQDWNRDDDPQFTDQEWKTLQEIDRE